MRTALILLLSLLALVIECQGENIKKVQRPVLIEENMEDTESGEEAFETDSINSIDNESQDEFVNVTSNESILKKKKAATKPDSERDNNDEWKEGDTAKTGTDILTEGQPGWMEKLLKKTSKELKSKSKEKEQDSAKEEKQMSEGDKDIHLADAIPKDAVNKLQNVFGKLGTQATGAKNGLTELKGKWNKISFGDRMVMTQTLQAAASNIDKFAKAGENPIGAVQGALNMVAQFAALAGPTGQIVAVALSFVSGFLSLFGAGGKKKKSIGEIVREEIDEALAKFYEKDLSNEAEGISRTFQVSKAYVDRLAQRGKKLTVPQAASLERNVPLYLGLPFMGKLASEINGLLKANKRSEAKKTLRYIELYTKMAILKDMIMQEAATLLPVDLEPNRQALLAAQASLRGQQKQLLKFLRESKVGIMALNYFDPDNNPITDSYLTKVLKVPDYDRSMAGIWCLTPYIDKKLHPITWMRDHSSLMKDGHPYITPANEGCHWKLIPHGNHLYTVQNVYKCPKYDFCGQYLSYDIIGDNSRATVRTDADLWEIFGSQQKRIRSKWGCDSNSKWCNRQLKQRIESTGGWSPEYVVTFYLTDENVGYIWFLTKKPIKIAG